MAGDWIKMRTDLMDDPAVILMAARLGLDEDSVVGKLHRLWSWADKHTTDGMCSSITKAWVDRFVSKKGFFDAMAEARWIQEVPDGIQFPAFDKHNGSSAKKRSDASGRKRLSRKTCDKSVTNVTRNEGQVCDESVTREEKRREEKKNASHSSISSEPASQPAELVVVADEVVLEFPVVGGSSKTWPLTASKVREWTESFPGLDVLAEARLARQWCIDNESKRKTPRGMTKFLFNWLERNQNRGRTGAGGLGNARGAAPVGGLFAAPGNRGGLQGNAESRVVGSVSAIREAVESLRVREGAGRLGAGEANARLDVPGGAGVVRRIACVPSEGGEPGDGRDRAVRGEVPRPREPCESMPIPHAEAVRAERQWDGGAMDAASGRDSERG